MASHDWGRGGGSLQYHAVDTSKYLCPAEFIFLTIESILTKHFVNSHVNPCSDGGILRTPPSSFPMIAKKCRRAVTPFCVYLSNHPYRTFPIDFGPRSSQVSYHLPGQVKWSYPVKNVWWFLVAIAIEQSIWNFQGIIRSLVTTKKCLEFSISVT